MKKAKKRSKYKGSEDARGMQYNIKHSLHPGRSKMRLVDAYKVKKQIDEKLNKEWIPCSAKLPNIENKDYLVSIGKRTIMTCTWTKEGWNTFKRNDGTYDTKFRFNNVIAWMPLPKPYKED